MTDNDPAADTCGQCTHPLSLHALMPSDMNSNPMSGGIALCPVWECQCFFTWGVGANKTLSVPSDEEIQRLRMAVQTGEFT